MFRLAFLLTVVVRGTFGVILRALRGVLRLYFAAEPY